MRPLASQREEETSYMKVLVTGSTDGLGRRVAELLVETVLVHGRDPAKVEDAVRAIGAAGGYVADLSSLDRVRRLADDVSRDHDRLDVLVNNAGVVAPERRQSADGHELTFAVNHLAHFLLTLELLPLLDRSAPARIVNVSSVGQQAIDFDDVMLERGYDAFRAYSQSKLAQVMFTFELAERLGDGGVTVDALHPATLMDTKMVRQSLGRAMTSVDEGAEAVLRLTYDDGGSGRYFDGMREAAAHRQAYDAKARRRLWTLSEELTGLSRPTP
jgi:NAD(P)-dependent dehydrogenase (short-subunit alcohol dehydrogenase family)